MDPAISVVVVTFNTAQRMLDDCLVSVRDSAAHAGFRVQVILVDNGSSQPPHANVDGLDVSIFQQTRNMGFGHACNVGIHRSSAPFVLLLNPDAMVRQDALGALLSAASRREHHLWTALLLKEGKPQVDAYMLWWSSIQRKIMRPYFERRLTRAVATLPEVSVRKVSGGALFAKRLDLLSLGPFDERFFLYSEDADLSCRAVDAGFQLRLLPSARAVHLAATSQQSHGTLVERARADGAIRLAAYHRGPIVSLLLRLELLLVTVGGMATDNSSSSRTARLHRLPVIAKWGVRRDIAPLVP